MLWDNDDTLKRFAKQSLELMLENHKERNAMGKAGRRRKAIGNKVTTPKVQKVAPSTAQGSGLSAAGKQKSQPTAAKKDKQAESRTKGKQRRGGRRR